MFKSRYKSWALAIPAAVLLMGAAAACGDDDDDDTNGTQEPTQQAATTTTDPTTTATTGGGDADSGPITISMTDNEFDPSEITIPAGTPVEITVENDGAAVHNMVLEADGEEFASDQIVAAGDSSTFTVEIATPGTYEFDCEFHIAEGMKGTLTVE